MNNQLYSNNYIQITIFKNLFKNLFKPTRRNPVAITEFLYGYINPISIWLPNSS